jgi:hypothetical protein
MRLCERGLVLYSVSNQAGSSVSATLWRNVEWILLRPSKPGEFLSFEIKRLSFLGVV